MTTDLTEGNIVEICGQKFLITYVDVWGNLGSPWIRELKLLGIKNE